MIVSNTSHLSQYCAPGGGYAISIKEATAKEVNELKKL
jgi:hypothetical protein